MKKKPLTDKDGEVRELTEEEILSMHPAAELPPELAEILPKRPDPEMIDDENPEWTDEDFRRARPATEYLSPELYAILTNRKPGESGPQRAGKAKTTYFVEIVTVAGIKKGEPVRPRVIGRVELDEPGGEVRLVNCEPWIEKDLREGLGRHFPWKHEGPLIMMQDGMKFLEALKWEYRSSYTSASDLKMETGKQEYPGIALEVKFTEDPPDGGGA